MKVRYLLMAVVIEVDVFAEKDAERRFAFVADAHKSLVSARDSSELGHI